MSEHAWAEVNQSLDTPAGRQRAKEMIRAALGIASWFFPGSRAVAAIIAVLPFVDALLKRLGYKIVNVDPGAPPQQKGELTADEIAANLAVRQGNPQP